MPKLSEFSFKWSVSLIVSVSRSPAEKKRIFSNSLEGHCSQISTRTVRIRKKVRMRKEKSKNV